MEKKDLPYISYYQKKFTCFGFQIYVQLRVHVARNIQMSFQIFFFQ